MSASENHASQVVVHDDFDALPASFRALLEDAPDTTFDQSLPWLEAMRASLLKRDGQACVLCLTDANGDALAVLPLLRRGARLGPVTVAGVQSLSNFYTSHFDPVLRVDADPRAVGTALADAMLARIGNWRRLDLHPMDLRSPLFEAMASRLHARGCFVQRYFRFGNWYLKLRGRSYDEYFADLPSSLRNTIRRKGRKLARAGNGRHVIVTAEDGLEQALGDYERVYRNSWKQSEPDEAFIRDIVRRFAQRDQLRLGVCYLDDQPASAQIWFVHNGTASIYKLAYDERYKFASVGSLLTAELMRHVIETDGVHTVDYLTGDEPYKKGWMSDRRERWGIRAYRAPLLQPLLAKARGATRPVIDTTRPVAVVVGLCTHGLATVRALARAGVKVYALERNRALPGSATRYADVTFTSDINGDGLADGLRELRTRIATDTPPFLFLTNDNMVAQVAQDWEQIDGDYELVWSHCRDVISSLMAKSALKKRCEDAGLNYPKSWVLNERDDIDRHAAGFAFPMIIKPVRPLGGFKAITVASITELIELVSGYASDYPFLLQQFIPGDDRQLYFCALYLDHGKELARFIGRKVLSHPPARGQTTVAEPSDDEDVYAQTCRFFDGLALSGPVSLELKRAPDGSLWVIEPTVGRTDFWLPVCIANGVNIPVIGYRHMAGESLGDVAQRGSTRWFDTERDPASYLRTALEDGGKQRKAVFSFWNWRDPLPFLRNTVRLARTTFTRLWRGRSA